MNKRFIGKKYELIASSYLKNNDYEIITTNFWTKIGEIDIIAENDGYLCFIEVKYRDKSGLTKGFEAVDKKKQKTIYKVAQIYMIDNKIDDNIKCRFDVISIDGDDIKLFKNAFP